VSGGGRKILVAVAWPYANGPRHIGHVAGFGVPSDVFSRYMRMAGHDVLMVSGTDEHGTPILVQAEREGVTPKALADRYNRVIVEDLQGLGLSYDLFTRTTTKNHYRVTQDLFRTLYAKGYVIEQETLGAFSASTGHTLPDRYIEGTCPICGYESARGDQCDNCGNQLDPVDLVDPRSRIDGEPPVFDILFTDRPVVDYRATLTADRRRIALFNEECLRRGVVKAVNKIYVSLAHSEADVHELLDVFDQALAAVAARTT